MCYEPEQAARVCYAAVRQLREEQGDRRGAAWDLLPGQEREWYCRAMERAASGMLPAGIHGAWRRELEADGWIEAPDISHADRTHPELVPWDALGEPSRRRFFLMQMIACGLFLDIPLGSSGMAREASW